MTRIKEVCKETWDEFRQTQNIPYRERLHAVLLSNNGLTRREIAEVLFCDISDVKSWLAIYSDLGLEGLKNFKDAPSTKAGPIPDATAPTLPKPSISTAPAVVTELVGTLDCNLEGDVQKMIRECLRFSPRIYGRRSKVWSTKALADVLAQNLGREVPRDEIRTFLQSAGVAKLETTQQFVKRTTRMKAIDDVSIPESPAAETADAASALPQEAANSEEAAPTQGENFADPWSEPRSEIELAAIANVTETKEA
jgi:transposase